MNNNKTQPFMPIITSSLDIIEVPDELNKIFMGSRVCDNCGKTKDTLGGKSCSKGHFICHSCASGHVHCPLCRHTLR